MVEIACGGQGKNKSSGFWTEVFRYVEEYILWDGP